MNGFRISYRTTELVTNRDGIYAIRKASEGIACGRNWARRDKWSAINTKLIIAIARSDIYLYLAIIGAR